MNKEQYLEQIRQAFSFLPPLECDEIVSDYRSHFAEALSEGRTEGEIIQALGSPQQLAKQSKAAFRIQEAQDNTTPFNLLRAVLASLALGFFNLILILAPFIVACVLLLLGFLAGIVFSIAGVALILASFPLLGGYLGMVSLLFGIALGALGILVFTINLLVARGFSKLTILYLQKNIAIIKGA